MNVWNSARFKIVVGSILVVAPMVLLVIYSNLYAMDIVRQQLTSHYSGLLAVNVEENDNILDEYYTYLLRLERHPDIPLIQSLSVRDSDYTLAKIRLLNQFALDSGGIYYSMDTLFMYSRRERDLFYATQYNQNSAEKQDMLLEWSRERLDSGRAPADHRWLRLVVSGTDGADIDYLLRVYDLGLDLYAGVLVRTASLMRVLERFDVGPDGTTLLMNAAGDLLVDNGFGPLRDASFRKRIAAQTGTYGEVEYAGRRYVVMSQPSAVADVTYVIVTTESYLLQNLPFLQKLLYLWVPLMVALLLSVFLLLMQRIVFRPLAALIRGMRKLGHGQLNVRLPVSDSSEFAFVSGTFNQMAEQIAKLKIDVYEEQLRVQRAEYKHLQVQINPHFYMNSLNIIYNLAALKDFKTVQKLSLHLADYFRFLMQSHRSSIRLEDEIRHIRNYLEIQKLRYVSKLDYDIRIGKKHLSRELSPLLLQPFVENAVIHGYSGKAPGGEPFRIDIASADADGADAGGAEAGIVVTVADNGPGFPDGMLRELADGTYGAEESGERHLGIWNVLRRYAMLYGDAGGVTFGNRPEGGAIVTVRLPPAQALDEASAGAAREGGTGSC